MKDCGIYSGLRKGYTFATNFRNDLTRFRFLKNSSSQTLKDHRIFLIKFAKYIHTKDQLNSE